MFENSETETCLESCIFHCPTTPPCSTKVDVLETGDAPILFLPLRMRNLGMIIELDPQGDGCMTVQEIYRGTRGHSALAQITLAQLMRKAPTVRNTQITLSGKTSMELAMGRRPRYLLDPASLNPDQLASTPTTQDLLNEEIEK